MFTISISDMIDIDIAMIDPFFQFVCCALLAYVFEY